MVAHVETNEISPLSLETNVLPIIVFHVVMRLRTQS